MDSLGILAGGIAHDFNNLLGGIFGYIDCAISEYKDEKAAGYLSKAMNTIDRARSLTRQFEFTSSICKPFTRVELESLLEKHIQATAC